MITGCQAWGFLSWYNCSTLQPDSRSVSRFMSSSVTRPTVTVINSAVAQMPSYRVWPAASSVSRQLCLYTSSSSLSLSRRQTTSSLPSRPGRHRLSLLAVSFIPCLTLLLPHSHLFLVVSTPGFIIDCKARWRELDVSFVDSIQQ